MYQAELYCEECGEKLAEKLITEGKLPKDAFRFVHSGDEITIVLDENAYDSDDFPKYVGDPGSSDSPDHCASGSECVNALDLAPYHGLLTHETIPGTNRKVLQGAETRKIGAWLENDLTGEGEAALTEMVNKRNPTPYQSALHAFWREVYDTVDFETDED